MLRNIGIVAHVNAGKTTLSEQILFLTGKQGYLGEVEAGTATMDCQPQEQERGISISAAMTRVQWGETTIHLIDTPGHVDFGPETERALQAIDGVVVVLDGVRGVESQTEAVWRLLDKHKLPRLVFINKLDREFADYQPCLELLRERFATPAVSLEVSRPELRDCIDLLTDDCKEYAEARLCITEACSDFDESITSDYIKGKRVSEERLKRVLRRATLEGGLVPVLGGSALEGWGVRSLLDAVCAYLPGPGDRQRYALGGQPLIPARTDAADLVALVFKVVIEDGTMLGFVRIFQGSMRVGDQIETSTGQEFVVSALWSMHAMDREAIVGAGPGAVLAIPLPAGLGSGQTLRATGSQIELRPLQTSPPVLAMSLEPQVSAGRSLLQLRAEELIKQDPSLVLAEDPVTGDLLVSGLGELHLGIFGSLLQAALPQPARLGRPSVREAEAPLAAAIGEGVCQRHLGTQFLLARVLLRVEPRQGGGPVEHGLGAEIECVAPDLLAGLLAYVAEVCGQGLSAGRPLRGARVELLAVDVGEDPGEGSADLARDATRLALQRALKSAGIVTLEPRMRFQVDCPSEFLSVVLAELRSRQADIVEVTPSYGVTRVCGGVALARVLGWSTSLRSVTKGMGELQLEFTHFAAKEPCKKA